MSILKTIEPYIDIARPSHWVKNVFVVPGMLLAVLFVEVELGDLLSWDVLLAFVATCLVASSYYVLNEILDAEGDAHHPDKRKRPIPSGRVRIPVAYAEFAVLALAAFAVAYAVSLQLLICLLVLWACGLAYNVRPLRLKDRAYFDVICESINNPLRLAIGWYAVGPSSPPTLSAIAAYWLFGAYLMFAKRLAEYRHIGDPERARNYRLSFGHYTEPRLLRSIMFCGVFFGMSAGVFIARYRVELILAIPFVALALAHYLKVGLHENSPVQHPELLHRDRKLMLFVAMAFVVSAALLLIDVPPLARAFAPMYALPE